MSNPAARIDAPAPAWMQVGLFRMMIPAEANGVSKV